MPKVEIKKVSTRNFPKYHPSANKPFDDVSDTVDKKERKKAYLIALERNGGKSDMVLSKKRRKFKNGKM